MHNCWVREYFLSEASQAKNFHFPPPWGLPKLGNFHFSPPGSQAREFSLFPREASQEHDVFDRFYGDKSVKYRALKETIAKTWKHIQRTRDLGDYLGVVV